jgi:hypothetical protein
MTNPEAPSAPGRPPYIVMIDEAGISGTSQEGVTVVAAVVFPSGQPAQDVYDAVDAVHDMAPARYREDFVFHAKDLLWADNGPYSEGWPIEERQMMMHAMLQVPFDMVSKSSLRRYTIRR